MPSSNRRASVPRWVFEPPQSLGAAAAAVGNRLPPDEQAAAEVIYGETAGLYPRPIDPNRPVTDPSNWDPRSRSALHNARRGMGVVSERNSDTHGADGSRSRNPLEARQWGEAASAARTRQRTNLPLRTSNFYIRNRDVEPHPPRRRHEYPDAVYIATYGTDAPFVNVGGGDVEPGSNIVIDFYGPPEQRRRDP